MFFVHSGGNMALALWQPHYQKCSALVGDLNAVNIGISIGSQSYIDVACAGTYAFGIIYGTKNTLTYTQLS